MNLDGRDSKGRYTKNHKLWKGNVYFGEDHLVTEDIRTKMSISRKGKKHWWGDRISKAKKGVSYSLESRQNMSNGRKGMILSSEHKKSVSEGMKKFYLTEEGVNKRKQQSEIRSKITIPFKDTKLEITVQSYLESLGMIKGIDYIKHKPFKVGNSYHQVDIYIPKCNLPIECDGVYWHSLPGAKERDRAIDKGLFKQYGLQVLRLSESCIQNGDFKCMVDEKLFTKDLTQNIVQ